MNPKDEPKMLANADAVNARKDQLQEPHVAPLTELVDEFRRRSKKGGHIPYFDPWDGGIDAEVLFLLEAPGPKAIASGFVSRNNPDETAKNFFELSTIERKRTAIWNVVPWYIHVEDELRSDEAAQMERKLAKIRPAGDADIDGGKLFLEKALGLMPKLKAIVLVGRKAQKVRAYLQSKNPSLRIFECPHPSPRFINRSKEANRQLILNVMNQIESFLNQNHERFGWSSIDQVVILKLGDGA